MIAVMSGRVIVWRPLAITLCLHGLLVYVLTLNLSSQTESTSIKPRQIPRYVEARLVTADMLKPTPKPKAQPKAAAKPAARKPATSAKPKPSAVKTTPKPATKPRATAAAKPVAAAPVDTGPTAAERAALARAELSMALDAEDIMVEEASDQEVTQSYVALIARVIQDNWSRPPSARNEMEAELVIQLIPTGEVVSVTLARGSGSAAFDRSAITAVMKAERFPELQDLPSRLFEKDFRQLRLLFKPEDLRY